MKNQSSGLGDGRSFARLNRYPFAELHFVMKFYQIEVERIWGESGNVIVHGSTGLHDELERHSGPANLERIGPSCPQLTLPGLHTLIVTNSFRKRLEDSPFAGLSYSDVNIKKCVDMPWQNFRRDADVSPVLENGETAEDHFFVAPHSPSAASGMEKLWQCHFDVGCVIEVINQASPWDYDVAIDAESWNGRHLFLGRDKPAIIGKWIVTTDLGKDWLETHNTEWIEFRELAVLDGERTKR